MNTFIVSAHPDDETLGMGGTILKLKKRGDKVFWILLTTPNDPDELLKVNTYIENAKDFFNYDKFYWLKIPVKNFGFENLSQAIDSMRKIFEKIIPDIVFTVSDTDIHSDHFFTYKAVLSSLKPFTVNAPKLILKYEVLSSTNVFPTKSYNFVPNVFSDITDFIKDKERAFEIFYKEVQELPFPRNKDTIRALARFRGSMTGVMYAEAFEFVYGRLECLMI